jgi:hypothetical protein
MNAQKNLIIFALLAVLGLAAIETVDLILTMQVAEARGCVANPGGAACAELMQVGEDASTSSY